MIEQLDETWSGILEFLNGLVVPDWGSLVNLMPIFLVVGVVGPLLSLIVLFWFIYFVRKPRTKVAYVDPVRPAPRDEQGSPMFPSGEPYSVAEARIYPPGATRSEAGEPLLVRCPKCDLVRPAEIDTCGNCGLSVVVRPATITVRPAGPPPGGAAVA